MTTKRGGTTYTQELARFTLDCDITSIPTDVREKASLFLLDSIGLAVANSGEPFAKQFARTVGATVAKGPCTAIGFPDVLAAEGAAALNATTIHGTDFDPTHLRSIIHPSCVVIPVALAVAEEAGRSGSDLLAAIVAGFEVLIRMGLASRGEMHRSGFQATSLCAPVALAMVGGKLYGMSRDQLVDAAGLTTSIASGLRTFADDGTWGKRIIMGWACRAALTAIALAKEGYPGTLDALEKQPYGFYRSFAPGADCDLAALTRGLGQEWETRDTDFKRYPCAHGHHVFIETARRAKAALNLQPEKVASVGVRVSSTGTYWFEPRELRYSLEHIYGARFSMPYTIALALVFGDVTDQYLKSREFLEDPRVRNLVPRIEYQIDSTLVNFNPNLLRGDLEVTTIDGAVTTFEGAGSLAGEQFRSAVHEKFRSNTEHILGAEKTDSLIALAAQLETQSDIKRMMALLRY